MLSLAFAKLVATPTDDSWSQVYNAGNLFASLSLSKEPDDQQTQLSVIGKDMFSHLESEFFTLEDKNLESIKEAIANSTHTIPSNITANLSLAFFKENILYVFIFGQGTITMKRSDKAGTLLEESTTEAEIKSSSGFMENGDVIVLQTPQFAKDMSEDTISQALELDLPSDIAEALSPAMHEKDDGGQAAIIIKYQGSLKPFPEDDDQSMDIAEEEKLVEIVSDNMHIPEEEVEVVKQETLEDFEIPETTEPEMPKRPSSPKFELSAFIVSATKWFRSKFSLLQNKYFSNLDHRKKIFLSIAVIIVIILVLSVSLSKKKQEDGRITAQFLQIYDPALKDYQNGIDIKSINSEFAREDFLKAKDLLTSGQNKFKKGSKEKKQITELLEKVDKELGGGTTVTKITPKTVSVADNNLLSVEKENNEGVAYATDKDSVLLLTDDAVVSVDKSGNKKDVIENDSDWEKGVGLSAYQGNIYVLDQENGVLKFTAGSDGFGKSSYLKEKPDLSTAQALAIDGSVFILLKDGDILKYTRGVSDGFKVKGLDKPMSQASKIFTNIDTENLYVLDRGNSRIVKINKEGSFQTQYVADILKSAKDIEVSEEDDKILVLSGDKIWEIPL